MSGHQHFEKILWASNLLRYGFTHREQWLVFYWKFWENTVRNQKKKKKKLMTFCLPLSIFRFPSPFLFPLNLMMLLVAHYTIALILNLKVVNGINLKVSNFMSVLLRVFSIACLKVVNILDVKKKLKHIRLVKSAWTLASKNAKIQDFIRQIALLNVLKSALRMGEATARRKVKTSI